MERQLKSKLQIQEKTDLIYCESTSAVEKIDLKKEE